MRGKYPVTRECDSLHPLRGMDRGCLSRRLSAPRSVFLGHAYFKRLSAGVCALTGITLERDGLFSMSIDWAGVCPPLAIWVADC